jgi:hypothetical protein
VRRAAVAAAGLGELGRLRRVLRGEDARQDRLVAGARLRGEQGGAAQRQLELAASGCEERAEGGCRAKQAVGCVRREQPEAAAGEVDAPVGGPVQANRQRGGACEALGG